MCCISTHKKDDHAEKHANSRQIDVQPFDEDHKTSEIDEKGRLRHKTTYNVCSSAAIFYSNPGERLTKEAIMRGKGKGYYVLESTEEVPEEHDGDDKPKKIKEFP